MEDIKDPFSSAGEAKLYYKDLAIGHFQAYSLSIVSITELETDVCLKRGMVQVKYLPFLNTEEKQLSVSLFTYEHNESIL
jgi:hypothetical protein